MTIETPDREREIPRQDKNQEESALPQGRGESLVAQLDSAVNQAEQLRAQQTQQHYSDQLGVYVQEKAKLIGRLQSSLAASLISEQAQLQAIQQRAPGWTAGKKAHAQWEQQVARRKTRIAQLAQRLDRVGEIEEAAGVYAERKIEELAERKLRLDKPELFQEWDKIRHRERQTAISADREHSKPRPGPWEITDSLQSGRRRMSDSRVHRRSARSDAEQNASPAWKSKTGFQLPPDVSYEKQRLAGAWAYVFRHRVLGEFRRILLQNRDGRCHISCEVVGDASDPMTTQRTGNL